MFENPRRYMPEVGNKIIPKLIREVAAESGFSVINVFEALGGGAPGTKKMLCDEPCDGIHPSESAQVIIA